MSNVIPITRARRPIRELHRCPDCGAGTAGGFCAACDARVQVAIHEHRRRQAARAIADECPRCLKAIRARDTVIVVNTATFHELCAVALGLTAEGSGR